MSAGAASSGGPRDAHCNGLNIRTGNPGDHSRVVVEHPIGGQGHHNVTRVTLSFRYTTGYTPAPGAKADAPVVTFGLLDVETGAMVSIFYTSPPLSNYSFDRFTGYSPPIEVTQPANATQIGSIFSRVMGMRIAPVFVMWCACVGCACMWYACVRGACVFGGDGGVCVLGLIFLHLGPQWQTHLDRNLLFGRCQVDSRAIAVDNARPLFVVMDIANNQRNLQIPVDQPSGFNITVFWSAVDAQQGDDGHRFRHYHAAA